MHIPQNIRNNIFSYLHQPYDYEKARVIQELDWKIKQMAHRIFNWKLCSFDVDECRIHLLLDKL